jgi:hypothetical protein
MIQKAAEHLKSVNPVLERLMEKAGPVNVKARRVAVSQSLAPAMFGHALLTPLAPRGTSGERAGERGFLKISRLLSLALSSASRKSGDLSAPLPCWPCRGVTPSAIRSPPLPRRWGIPSALLLAGNLLCHAHWGSAATAENYLSALHSTIAQTRSNLAMLSQSADRAAAEFAAGGNLRVAGRQADFIGEACGRAGGLMAIAPLNQGSPTNHDVILYAAPGSPDAEDLKVIDQWQARGATVIQFTSSAGLYRGHFPVDTVANVVNLWTWTGEFVAACTRLGRMPVLYQSYGLPGGPERGKKYQGKRFHDDLTIKAIPAEALGRDYLDRIDHLLTRIGDTQMPRIIQAAEWWGPATSATILVTGHMFPRHAQDPRARCPGTFIAVPAWEDKELLDVSHLSQLVLYLGYQFAPRKLLDQARAHGVKLVYWDVQPARPPEPATNILYIDPAWPLADACVVVPGYDIPILPASGVIQAAIYWTIASERGP